MTVRTVHNHETLVSPDSLYSAVMIPKNASTSLAKHYKAKGWTGANDVVGWPFAFIRHPLDRYISQLYQTWLIDRTKAPDVAPSWQSVCERGWVHQASDVHMFPQHRFIPEDCTLIPLESVLPLLAWHERKMPDDIRKVSETHHGWMSYCRSFNDWDIDEELWNRAWAGHGTLS